MMAHGKHLVCGILMARSQTGRQCQSRNWTNRKKSIVGVVGAKMWIRNRFFAQAAHHNPWEAENQFGEK